MLNGAGSSANDDVDLYPAALRQELDRVNAFVYDNVNNGVYRCDFGTAQGRPGRESRNRISRHADRLIIGARLALVARALNRPAALRQSQRALGVPIDPPRDVEEPQQQVPARHA